MARGSGITLGDLEEPFTVEAILSSPAQPAARIAALEEYVGMTRQTAYGQLLDIRNGTLPPGTVTERDVLDVHRLKSAVYTVSSPLKIGALLGGSTPARLRDLEALAIDLGIAFQLRDDVLGAGFGSEDLGKSANDLIEGKRTLLVVRAWSEGSASDRAALEAVLGNPNAGDQDVENARKAIRSTGSLAYSEKRIEELTRRALGRLARSRSDPGQRKAVADRGRGPVDAKNGLTGAYALGLARAVRADASGLELLGELLLHGGVPFLEVVLLPLHTLLPDLEGLLLFREQVLHLLARLGADEQAADRTVDHGVLGDRLELVQRVTNLAEA